MQEGHQPRLGLEHVPLRVGGLRQCDHARVADRAREWSEIGIGIGRNRSVERGAMVTRQQRQPAQEQDQSPDRWEATDASLTKGHARFHVRPPRYIDPDRSVDRSSVTMRAVVGAEVISVVGRRRSSVCTGR